MRTTDLVKLFARVWHRIVTWSRRTLIGDRVLPRTTPICFLVWGVDRGVVILEVYWSGDNIDSISRTTDCRYFHRQRRRRSRRTRSLRQRSPPRKSQKVHSPLKQGLELTVDPPRRCNQPSPSSQVVQRSSNSPSSKMEKSNSKIPNHSMNSSISPAKVEYEKCIDLCPNTRTKQNSPITTQC